MSEGAPKPPPPPPGGFVDVKAIIEKRRKETSWKIWHGLKGDKNWEPPECVAFSTLSIRPDQGVDIDASEYVDKPEVLDAKMKLLAELLKKSKHTMVYTGAGISRGAGIPDYASKAKGSVMRNEEKLQTPFQANPTFGHCVLTNLERMGLVHYYVQQNHDGLPQKAGFPQEKMNEIHGAWFDPSNRVVQFHEHLRSDLYSDMVRMEKSTDLCLCMGTSLSGMNADRVVKNVGRRYKEDKRSCLGSVIVNLQMTPVDMKKFVSLRVWGKIDDAMKLLVKHLGVEEVKIYHANTEMGDVVEIPYDENGELLGEDCKKLMVLDLRKGEKVRVFKPGGERGNHLFTVIDKDPAGHYQIFNKTEGKLAVTWRLGNWWLETLRDGKIKQCPVVNENPKFVKRKKKKRKK